MQSHQDIVGLSINDDDDCLFPTELGEMASSLLEMDGMVGNKETAKQNHVKQEENDTLGIYGSEDGEILTEKRRKKKKARK